MGIYACGCYGSRSPEGAVMRMRPWGYRQEEVKEEKEKEEEKEVGLSFEI